MEIWEEIALNPFYQVSNLGNVRRIDAPKNLSQVLRKDGYFQVALGKGPRFAVHILVAAAFIGPRPKGLEINHKDAVKTNNTPENLEYVTRLENVRHAMNLGLYDLRQIHGEANGQSKLTVLDVKEIRQRYSLGGITFKQLALEHHVHPSLIRRIIRRLIWKHI